MSIGGNDIKEKMIEYMKESVYKPLLLVELMEAMDIDWNQKKIFTNILNEMEKDGQIMKSRSGRYGVPEKMGFMTGVLVGHWKGYGFVDSDRTEINSVYIPSNMMNGALHQDLVLVKVNQTSSEAFKAEGEIVRVLKRGITEVVGTFQKSKNHGFCVPDDHRFHADIFLPGKQNSKAPNGHKIVCKITSWPENRRNPEGKIVEVLGDPNSPDTDLRAIIKKHHLPESFSKKTVKETKMISQEIGKEEIKHRKDLRDTLMVTIDGLDAKDLDDAVSIEKIDSDTFQLGVHIADVAHYVKKGTELDKDAFKRATSVYLVDRVLPMLPHQLSNGICSLNPNEDRLALSVIMKINTSGIVEDYEIAETIIRTDARMTYDDVSDMVENHDETLIAKYKALSDSFFKMKELCQALRKKREERGAIDFDFPESKVILDNTGYPIDIIPEERRIANRMIEEFMLVCNETVAEHFYWLKNPFVYRVHEEPDSEKLLKFKEFIYHFGYTLKGQFNSIHPKTLQLLLKEVEEKKEGKMINAMMLRSLKKARYTTKPLGHYGLAAEHYCHFTSPIRRYPDLAIHRIIKEHIQASSDLDQSAQDKMTVKLEEISKYASEMERKAEEAERESKDLKKALFMKERIGCHYNGFISSVTSFGIFIELENSVEGLTRLSDMDDDYYRFDQKQLKLTGEKTKKTYSIGDYLMVKIEDVDVKRREIHLSIVDDLKNDLSH
ncbi:ribonuclease R [Tindallia californiensis]|nr:ribonuclease R [Tindallia californiensis]